jgi:prevent-host-death family protein
MEVSIREMKNNLSKYLKRAQAGEEVLITDRGRPVARLVSAATPQDMTIDDAVARLRGSALIRPGGGGRPKGAKRPIVTKRGEKTLAELLLEDRR